MINNTSYNSSLKPTSKIRGFTLVETLVAVAILMIAIAGPLTIANQALTAALNSRNSMIGTYLAQDGMESLLSIKDNHVKSNDWKSYIGTGCTESYPCQTPIWNGSSFTVIQCTSACQLYKDSNDLYTYDGSGTLSPFKRYYYLSTYDSGNEYVATVVVSWTDGTIPNEIRLQDLLTGNAK